MSTDNKSPGGALTIAEEAVDQLQENEKLVAGRNFIFFVPIVVTQIGQVIYPNTIYVHLFYILRACLKVIKINKIRTL